MSNDKDEARALAPLHLALVRWQTGAMARGDKTVIIFEGRDAAGKDGAIKTITEHLSVRNTRIVALAKPSDRDKSSWFFQRYVAQLPAGGELVIFNRSWYNRAGVERVMGFSTPEEQEDFLRVVPGFETMLTGAGIRLIKLWLDVSKEEQAKRLAERKNDPLKVLKASPLDEYAQSHWGAYTAARDEMLKRTSHEAAPWTCVCGDHKKAAREAIMRFLARTLAPGEPETVHPPDPTVLFTFDKTALKDGRLER